MITPLRRVFVALARIVKVRNSRAPIDRACRLPRVWSNRELRKIAHLFQGHVVNVSAWKDEDKEGGHYRNYFSNARTYQITNCQGDRGLGSEADEIYLDLLEDLPANLMGGFDAVFNHTTLEHIFDVRKAFARLCALSRDVVVVVVPFAQVQHEGRTYRDYWRFTPSCLEEMFQENEMTLVYLAESPEVDAGVYLFAVGVRHPQRWCGILPVSPFRGVAGRWIGA